MHREHHLVSLWRPPCGARHQAGVQQGDVDADAAFGQAVAEALHGCEIREIHLPQLHRGGARQPRNLAADFRMSRPAGQDHVAAAPRQVHRRGLAQPTARSRHEAGPAVDAHALRNRVHRRDLRLPEIPHPGHDRARDAAAALAIRWGCHISPDRSRSSPRRFPASIRSRSSGTCACRKRFCGWACRYWSALRTASSPKPMSARCSTRPQLPDGIIQQIVVRDIHAGIRIQPLPHAHHRFHHPARLLAPVRRDLAGVDGIAEDPASVRNHAAERRQRLARIAVGLDDHGGGKDLQEHVEILHVVRRLEHPAPAGTLPGQEPSAPS